MMTVTATYDPEQAKTHELKTWPIFFDALATGAKTFELRINDRNFNIGDTLILREWGKDCGYTGRQIVKTVSYLIEGGAFGLERGSVCLALTAAPQHESQPIEHDRNMDGAREFIDAIIHEQPIWPNPWGQDVAMAAYFIHRQRKDTPQHPDTQEGK